MVTALTALTAMLLAVQAPVAGDTTVRVNGFVLMDAGAEDSTVARLILPTPLLREGARIQGLTLPGDAKRWARYRDRYVEAEGRWVAAGLAGAKVREANPPGTVSRFIEPSPSQRAAVTLAVVPRRVAWRDSTGRESGVQAVAYYTVSNHGDTQLYFRFTTPEIICVGVTRAGATEAHWRDAWRPRVRSELGLRVQLGSVVRYLMPIPEVAAPDPGRYALRVSLCGVTDYEVVTEFEVVG